MSARSTPTRVVVAFGDHLRPDQDVLLALREGRQERGDLVGLGRTVAVQATHARGGEALAELGLDGLGSHPQGVQRSTTVRAGSRKGLFVAAVVAQKAPPRAVQRQAHRAVDAGAGAAA